MPQNTDRANLVFRAEVARGHLGAVIDMLEKQEALDKVLHQVCAVQAALGKITACIQNQLLEQSISAIRANPPAEIDDREVNRLLSLYTSFHAKRKSG
jgi:DNA-binding FrmR family transcriptional regulator